MNRFPGSLAAALCMAVAGCVPTLHPLYTAKDATFDEGLIGTWKQDNKSSTWTFSRAKKAGANKYDVVIDMKEGKTTKQARMVGTLVRIKNTTYLDIAPGEPKKNFQDELSSFWVYHVLPLHTIWKIDRQGRTLKLSPMNPEWAAKYLKVHQDEIAHTTIEGRLVLTAPTEAVQKFVEKHKDTPKAFGNAMTLARQ